MAACETDGRYTENGFIRVVANPLISFFTGRSMRRVVETVTPQRTLADVVLPPKTRRTLEQALAEVRNHTLIFPILGIRRASHIRTRLDI